MTPRHWRCGTVNLEMWNGKLFPFWGTSLTLIQHARMIDMGQKPPFTEECARSQGKGCESEIQWFISGSNVNGLQLFCSKMPWAKMWCIKLNQFSLRCNNRIKYINKQFVDLMAKKLVQVEPHRAVGKDHHIWENVPLKKSSAGEVEEG